MDYKQKAHPHRSLAADLVAAGASGGNGAGGGHARTASAAPPGPPETLTQKFNRAAKKPPFIPANDRQRQLLIDMRDAIKEVTQPAKSKGVERPVSRQELERLEKQLKTPTVKHELKPRGLVTSDDGNGNSRKLIQEIKRQTRVLNQNKGKAKEQFNRASGISL